MAFKGPDAATTLGSVVGKSTSWSSEFPHLDCFVQTTGDKISAIGREGNRVNGVLMAVLSFETLDEVAGHGIPDADTLIKRAGCDVLGVWGDCNSRDTVFNAESQDVLAGVNIPETDGTVTTSGSNSTTIPSEVQRVNVLLMAGEGISYASSSNIPNL